MRAEVGDWLVAQGSERSEHRGMITEVHGPNGSPPYVVRWLESEQEALVFPGPDAIVATSVEQQAADERVRSRLASVQEAIMHRTAEKC